MIFLGVGTNLGNKEANIFQAYNYLEKAGIIILRKSALYHSPAWGLRDQGSFINTIIEVEFSESPLDLLEICLRVENQMGRKRTRKWGPRLIDIDIISFHKEIWNTDKLVLPHPFYTERSFVLTPLSELEPTWEVEATGKKINEYLELIPASDACIRIDNL